MSKEDIDDSAKVTIEDFVSEHKLCAFVNTYKSVDAEGPNVEVFTDARLRKYFQAFPRNIGDPLNWYLDALQRNGYNMKTSIEGEPAIFVKRKPTPHESQMLDALFHGLELSDNDNKITD